MGLSRRGTRTMKERDDDGDDGFLWIWFEPDEDDEELK